MHQSTLTQRLLISLLLITTCFSPAIFSWIQSESGNWYRSFIVWFVVIVVAFLLQREKGHKP
ncbi:hypothetical protein [Sessilibacter sp. MAH2]